MPQPRSLRVHPQTSRAVREQRERYESLRVGFRATCSHPPCPRAGSWDMEGLRPSVPTFSTCVRGGFDGGASARSDDSQLMIQIAEKNESRQEWHVSAELVYHVVAKMADIRFFVSRGIGFEFPPTSMLNRQEMKRDGSRPSVSTCSTCVRLGFDGGASGRSDDSQLMIRITAKSESRQE